MKKIIFLLMILNFCSCITITKPFMIYYKKIHYKDYGRAKYKYQDANGHNMRFFDSNDKYKIGDEIK